MSGIRKKILRTDRLRDLREATGLTQEEFAARLGYAATEQNRYENGKREPTPDRLSRMASELGVTTDYLVGLTDSPNENLRMEDLTDTEKLLIERFRASDVETMMRLAFESVPPKTNHNPKRAQS